MLFRSLRLRILVMFALVLMVAIGTVAFTAQQVTTRSFVQYAGSVNQQEQITLSKVLTIYRTNAGPAAVQRAVDQLAAADGRRIIFIGPDKRVIADSAHQLIGQVLSCTPPPPSPPSCLGPLSSKSAMEHVLILNTMPPDGVLFASTTGSTAPGTVKVRVRSTLSPAFNGVGYFVSSISRSLILAAILGGLLAFLLTLFLAARILRPVQALTKAAREMARGDLTQRVPVDGYDELAVLAGAFNVMADSVARAERLRRRASCDVA
ncbi:MAG: HAMP domain-containing protein, partial [Chloroflexi bacterium]|nr:HAMP domain-containing protein [Chloroflexota bacterium]